ncbi:phage portal protein [Alkalihalophilus marmarensis]|uniref:phage portal protein n=1 Tax=Alkalihalophilus marmarensis TaxID=521377 RepID=UPI00203DC882|nr:phage portal protein [Alkalihalophilus marmarensis]MCM3488790.1 phage portal protein [Alkalihalophilus marmarensis]
MFRLDLEGEPSGELIKKLIDKHDRQRGERLRDYYDGEHDILKREYTDESKPNNRIVVNFCKYITDVSVGNFLGTPVSYTSTDKKLMETLQDIFNYNDEQNINMKLGHAASVNGISFEILYTMTDEENKLQIRFDELNQKEQSVVLVFDRSVEKNIIMAIRHFEEVDVLTDEKILEAYVYTVDAIYHYVESDGEMKLQEKQNHYFRDVPINWYWNKSEDGKADFEDIMSLNDAYNSLQSDDINESEYANDAYLMLEGVEANDEDIRKMKEHRVIKLPEGGKASWLVKTINDTWKENNKTRIVNDIHKISGTPDMTDEKFAGTATGVALRYKLIPFENNRSAKERMFKKGLQRRIELICNLLNVKGASFDWRNVSMRFTSNLPVNEAELIEIVIKLHGTGLVSKETLRNLIPFIQDSTNEQEQIDKENEEHTDLDELMEQDDRIREIVEEVMNRGERTETPEQSSGETVNS